MFLIKKKDTRQFPAYISKIIEKTSFSWYAEKRKPDGFVKMWFSPKKFRSTQRIFGYINWLSLQVLCILRKIQLYGNAISKIASNPGIRK